MTFAEIRYVVRQTSRLANCSFVTVKVVYTIYRVRVSCSRVVEPCRGISRDIESQEECYHDVTRRVLRILRNQAALAAEKFLAG